MSDTVVITDQNEIVVITDSALSAANDATLAQILDQLQEINTILSGYADGIVGGTW